MEKGMSLLGFCILSLVSIGYGSVSVSSYLTASDQERLKTAFSSAAPYKDINTAYWSLRGLSLLNSLPKDTKTICEGLKKLPAETVEDLFSLTEAADLIQCTVSVTPSQEEKLRSALALKKVSQIYFGYSALENLNKAVDAKAVNSALEVAWNNDESPTSSAYAFLLAASLNLDIEKRYSLIEDVFAQADIIDGKYLQFEGGIFTTALVVEASYKLAAVAKKAPTIKPDQVLQLANYLLSRKHVNKLRNTVQLVAGLTTLSNNEYQVPVTFSIDSPSVVSSTSNKVIIRVSTLLGGEIGKVTLTADSGRHIADDAIVLSKKQLTPTSDPTAFELDFTNVKAPFGFYRIQLSATPAKPDARLVGLKGSVELKVVTSVKIDNVELGLAESDQASSVKTSRINYPGKLATKLEADFHQKIVMSFFVKSSSSGEAIKPHQVFVQLVHRETSQEIVFVATPTEGTRQYNFELDVGGKEKDFASLSGLYDMTVIIGDAVIDNPIKWTLAEVDLTFANKPSADSSGSQYKPKPVINHLFRAPEKRPPAVVSNVFTILCLTPFALMLILWLRIGANISNFTVSLSTIGFHAGFAGIFFLYYLYWTQLNMFDTIKYLSLLGIPTFLFGNQLLSSIAAKRKAK